MRRVLVIFSLFLVCGYCNASCHYGLKEPGTTTCKMSNGIILQDGESMKFPEMCENCHCSDTGWNCCGYGIYAGIMHVAGCKVVADEDGCSPKIVDILDESQPCVPVVG